MAKRPDREDIKAELRRQYGSLAAFERKRSLPTRSVTDVLIGRRRPAVAAEIAKVLGHSVSTLFPGRYDYATADDSAQRQGAHRLKAKAS